MILPSAMLEACQRLLPDYPVECFREGSTCIASVNTGIADTRITFGVSDDDADSMDDLIVQCYDAAVMSLKAGMLK